MLDCPCGSSFLYSACCGLIHENHLEAKTPEALMRSRYSAFVLGKADYIKNTMRPPVLDLFNEAEFSKKTEQWLGLQVIQSHLDPANPNIGYVEFKAKYQQNIPEKNKALTSKPFLLHELSKFQLEDSKWYYIDGKHFN